jgi:hypothetical protein
MLLSLRDYQIAQFQKASERPKLHSPVFLACASSLYAGLNSAPILRQEQQSHCGRVIVIVLLPDSLPVSVTTYTLNDVTSPELMRPASVSADSVPLKRIHYAVVGGIIR